MLQDRSIRTKLLGAVTIILLLMGLLGGVAFQHMDGMNSAASFVHEQTIPAVQSAEALQDHIAAYRLLQLEYTINISSDDRQRLEQRLAALEQAMERHLAEHQALVAAPNEAAIRRSLAEEWARFVRHTHATFLPAARQSNAGSVQPAIGRSLLRYQALLDTAQQLIQAHQERALAATQASRSAYQTAQRQLLGLTAGTLIIAAGIGLALAGQITGRLARLTTATRAVAAGDLQRHVSIESRDELGLLASSFNLMVDRLRDHQTMLQTRNTELQESVELQQQLMADLVARREAEEAALRARAAAEAASQAKTTFLATMSHELRTPLNAILGYAQVLHVEAQQEERLELAGDLLKIQRAGSHLLALINNVLDLSRIEAGQMHIESATFAVSTLIDEVASTVPALLAENENTLVLDLGQALGVMDSDATRLRQILFNLIGNATKFTSRGTITLRARREPGIDGGRLVFAVADTGIGIAANDLSRLFRPFQQIDGSVTRQYAGTGLGLALSRQLCHLLGGEIGVESSAGRGSTFTVVLPAAAPASLDTSDAAPSNGQSARNGAQLAGALLQE